MTTNSPEASGPSRGPRIARTRRNGLPASAVPARVPGQHVGPRQQLRRRRRDERARRLHRDLERVHADSEVFGRRLRRLDDAIRWPVSGRTRTRRPAAKRRRSPATRRADSSSSGPKTIPDLGPAFRFRRNAARRQLPDQYVDNRLCRQTRTSLRTRPGTSSSPGRSYPPGTAAARPSPGGSTATARRSGTSSR